MSERRKVSSKVSAALIDYVLREKKFSQEELAEAMEVSAAFVSRVRAGERSLTIDSLMQIERIVGVPLGALLLAAVPLSQPAGSMKKLQELARAAIAQADVAAGAIASAKLHAVAK